MEDVGACKHQLPCTHLLMHIQFPIKLLNHIANLNPCVWERNVEYPPTPNITIKLLYTQATS